MEVYLLVLFFVIGITTGSSDWESWKQTHAKHYLTVEEETFRQSIWETNSQFIVRHNSDADRHGYTLGMNEFGDLVSVISPCY